jgi:Zn-dependent M28 family amino/carboxypeptidase
MAIVLGVAKYMKEQNITPKCNVNFIGFCGEEHGMRGAYYYEALHRNENISMVIDLNQLGFNWTKTRLTLKIITNNKSLKSTINDIANRTDYINRTGNVTKFVTLFSPDGGPISNARVFANAKEQINRFCNTVLFVKTGQWYFHHKDGMNHQEGDVLIYFDWRDTSVTGEMVWNVTKYFTVNSEY